jgi:hypothetical protein
MDIYYKKRDQALAKTAPQMAQRIALARHMSSAQ